MPKNTKNATKLAIMTYFDSKERSIDSIAKEHGVHYTTIHKAINRLNFRHNRHNVLSEERKKELVGELSELYNN